MAFNLGTLAAMVVALFLAANTITVKFIHAKDHWMTFIAYPMMIQTPVIAFIVALREQPLFPEWSLIPWLWMICGGFFFAIGLILLPQAIKRTETPIFGYTQYITFLWAVILGYFIFSDMLDVWTATGAMIIVASGIFLIYREKVENSEILEIEEDGHIGQR
jgi:drug/metabolite transporter (DMT)-like permease